MSTVEMCKVFQPLWLSKKRYFVLTGGRGSLKSTHAHYFISDLLEEAGHGVLFTRFTMTSAETSIIPEFKVVAERLGRLHLYNITKTKVTHKLTGSFIIFSGIKTSSGDQTAKLKSISGITTLIVEEGEDFNDEDKFDNIEDSIRTVGKQNRIIWVQNPSTKHHFIYKKFFKDTNYKKKYAGFDVTMSNHPEVEHIHTTYHIAKKYLSKSILRKYAKARKAAEAMPNKYKSKYYQKYIGGWREQAEGVIFENWSEGAFPEYLDYCYGMDYGMTDPTALIRVAVDKDYKKIYLDEQLYKTNVSNENLLAAIEARIYPNDLIVADLNEKRTSRYLREKGINIKGAKKRKIVEDIREMEDYEIVVTPTSSNLKMELNEYCWNDKKADLPIDDFNHLIDAARYGFNRLTKARSITA